MKIVGFGPDKQGAGPIVNEGRIIWKQAITDETLDAKVAIAKEAADRAAQSEATALHAAGLAQQSAERAEQFMGLTAQLLGDKF